MKKILASFLITLSVYEANAEQILNLIINGGIVDNIDHCQIEKSKEVPFYVSDTSDPRNQPWYENLRGENSADSNLLGAVAIGSILDVVAEDENKIGQKSYAFIKVLRQSRYRHKVRKPVSDGFEAFVFGRSIVAPESWHFVVEKSELKDSLNEEEKYYLNGKSLVVSKDGDKYNFLECCSGDQCTDYPVFAVFEKNLENFASFVALNIVDLNFVSVLTPMRNRSKTTKAIDEDANSVRPKKDLTLSRQSIEQKAPRQQENARGSGLAVLESPRPKHRPKDLATEASPLAPKTSLLPKQRPNNLIARVKQTLSYIFPLLSAPTASFTSGIRRFGASRGGRQHAGADLYRPLGSSVVAMKAGQILRVAPFYRGTWAVEVLNDDGKIVRYTEIHHEVAAGITKGAQIRLGQTIGSVGKMKGIDRSMLHLELYLGTVNGPLTNMSNPPYLRRSDLTNPTPLLQDLLKKNLFAQR